MQAASGWRSFLKIGPAPAELKIDQETGKLTLEQKVEYWRKKSEEAARRQAERTKALNQAAQLNAHPAFALIFGLRCLMYYVTL